MHRVQLWDVLAWERVVLCLALEEGLSLRKLGEGEELAQRVRKVRPF